MSLPFFWRRNKRQWNTLAYSIANVWDKVEKELTIISLPLASAWGSYSSLWLGIEYYGRAARWLILKDNWRTKARARSSMEWDASLFA